MSELDFLLNRKKIIEKREEKNSTENSGNIEENREKRKENEEKKEERREIGYSVEPRKEESINIDSKKKTEENNTLEHIKNTEEKRENTIPSSPDSRKEEINLDNRNEENGKNTLDEEYREDSIENIMKKFLEKDPKIGVWSYPAYLVLQYLYNTKPGFKMSRVAKDALEYGLKNMYPDLFSKAEKISQLKQR